MEPYRKTVIDESAEVHVLHKSLKPVLSRLAKRLYETAPAGLTLRDACVVVVHQSSDLFATISGAKEAKEFTTVVGEVLIGTFPRKAFVESFGRHLGYQVALAFSSDPGPDTLPYLVAHGEDVVINAVTRLTFAGNA